jgi:CheY-like chemotaxis protein
MLARVSASTPMPWDIAKDGEDALYQASVNDYDLIILDLMLPGKDRFYSVPRTARRRTLSRARNHADSGITPISCVYMGYELWSVFSVGRHLSCFVNRQPMRP